MLITAAGIQFRSIAVSSSEPSTGAGAGSAVDARAARLSADADDRVRDDDEEDENEDVKVVVGSEDTNEKEAPSQEVAVGLEKDTTKSVNTATPQPRRTSFFDARIDDAIAASKARTARAKIPLSERKPLGVAGSQDDDDADAIALEMEKLLSKWSGKYAIIELDGKAKCEFPQCGKAFQSKAFLEKHIITRHGDTLKTFFPSPAEPYMRARYYDYLLVCNIQSYVDY